MLTKAQFKSKECLTQTITSTSDIAVKEASSWYIMKWVKCNEVSVKCSWSATMGAQTSKDRKFSASVGNVEYITAPSKNMRLGSFKRGNVQRLVVSIPGFIITNVQFLSVNKTLVQSSNPSLSVVVVSCTSLRRELSYRSTTRYDHRVMDLTI